METALQQITPSGFPAVWPDEKAIYTNLPPELALDAMSSLTPPLVDALTRPGANGVMTVTGYAISPNEWRETDEETGEVKVTRRRRVAIVTDVGTYATESETFRRELERIVAVFGQPTPDNPIKVRVYQRRANIGHSYGVVPYAPLSSEK